jgi:hypothetical protein
MILCPVCGKENDDLAVLCSSCRGYLQSKVDTLNLFETFWQLAESPSLAFKRIILARHKNYVMFLSMLVGMSMFFGILWQLNAANRFDNLLPLVGLGGAVGIPFGFLFIQLVSVVVVVAVRGMGGKATVKNARAVSAYAGMPLVMSLCLVLPLEIAIFGKDFFGSNPPPIVLNPVAYLGLLGFDILAAGWAIVLLHKGVRVLSGFGMAKTLLVTALTLVVPASLAVGRWIF